jgi:hypothetical protein
MVRRLGLLRSYERLRSLAPPSSFENVHQARAHGVALPSLTYGEVFFCSARSWLQRLGVGPGSVVLDIGSGRGMVLLAAHSLGATAIGMEINNRIAQGSEDALRACESITIIAGDATSQPWPAATHVVCTWTCFSDEQRAILTQRLERQPGVVATTTMGIPGAQPSSPLATTAGWLSTWVAKRL